MIIDFTENEIYILRGVVRRKLETEERRFNRAMSERQKEHRQNYITKLNNILEKLPE